MSVSKTFTNVNSQRLVDEYDEILCDYLLGISLYLWRDIAQRKSLCELLVEQFDDEVRHGKISQFKIIGDHRCNSTTDIKNGIFNLQVHFKQHNCVNITRMHYVVYTPEPDYIF